MPPPLRPYGTCYGRTWRKGTSEIHAACLEAPYFARDLMVVLTTMHQDISGDVEAAQANETHMPSCQDPYPTSRKDLESLGFPDEIDFETAIYPCSTSVPKDGLMNCFGPFAFGYYLQAYPAIVTSTLSGIRQGHG